MLAFAKANARRDLRASSSTLATDDTPDSDAYLSEAPSGRSPPTRRPSRARPPARFEGIPASDVDIVSVDGTVYAKLFGGFQDFDLPKLRAPTRPACSTPTPGFATVLTEAEEVSAGDAVRGGADNDEVLTDLHRARSPATRSQNLLPCAPGDEFDATFTVDDDGALRDRRAHRASSSTAAAT